MRLKPLDPDVEKALRQFETAALNFAYQAISISHVRAVYVRRAQEVTASLRLAYRTGEMSAKAAAEAAYGMRDALLRLQRQKSTAMGRALATELKAKGLSLDEVLAYRSQKQFGRPFSALDNAERTAVFLEVVESAGRPRPGPTKFAARAGAAGRAVFLLGIGLAAYNIANAEDPVWQTGRETSNIAGGLGGSIAAGAVAGIWLGPIGIGIGALVGGVAGALLADQAYVAAVGASDRTAGTLLKRFTSFFGTDEQAIADALRVEYGIDMDGVHAVFRAMDESYTTDADDVAVLYLSRVLREGGTRLEALRLNRPFRDTLIRILDEGSTSAEESRLVSKLRALR
jgi:hypothetical protein